MIVQVIVNGLLAGLTWGLLAVGFTLIYRVLGFFHVAYVTSYLIGAYSGVLIIQNHLTSVALASLVATCSAALAGCLIERGVYRPLRKRGSSGAILFIASLAVVAVGQNLTALLFGSEIRVAELGQLQQTMNIAGASVTIWQAIAAAAAIVIATAVWVFVRYSNFGRQLRAVASDRDLATVKGVPIDRIILWTVAGGSAMAGSVGFFVGCETAVTPAQGFSALLVTITAAIVGGIGSVRGSMLGGMLIGLLQHFSAWILPAHWQDTSVFLLLILFLCVKPHGLMGIPARSATV